MRILHVTLGFYPAEGWGGPVKSVHRLGKELVRRDHEVTVYCTNLLDKRHTLARGTCESVIDGIRVVYFHVWNLPWWPGSVGPIWPPELPSYLDREMKRFDVVHIHGYRCPMAIPVARMARASGIPIVTQPRGGLPIIVNSHRLKRLYDRLFGRLELEGISALIALQDSERQQALDHGIPGDRIVVIPNGIDPCDHQTSLDRGSFRRRLGIPGEKKLILFLGRINRKKGTDLLIEAFARMRGVDAQLVIAGPDDGQLGEIMALIQEYHLQEKVALPGLLTGADVWAALQDADLFVLPCRVDTFPNTVLEACLMAVPMVITEGCEMASLVKDRVADVVPFDARAVADAITSLLSNRERYERYRSNCESVMADTFSIRAVVDQVEQVYQSVIAEKARS